MTTSQIVWTIVIAAVVLALVAVMVVSMRRRSRADDRARASQLRERADTHAAGLPDAEARADQAEAHAERVHAEARRADEDAVAARTEADQQRAIQEDRIRAADRLDPDVDTRADDYAPQVATPAGPSSIDPGAAPEGDTAPRDPSVIDPTLADPTATPTATPAAPAAAPAAPHDSDHDLPLQDRINGHAPTETTDDDTPTGGSHRA